MYRYYKTLRFWESSIYLFIRIHVAQAEFNHCIAGDPVLLRSPLKGVYCHARLSQVYFVFLFFLLELAINFSFHGMAVMEPGNSGSYASMTNVPLWSKSLAVGLVKSASRCCFQIPPFWIFSSSWTLAAQAGQGQQVQSWSQLFLSTGNATSVRFCCPFSMNL